MSVSQKKRIRAPIPIILLILGFLCPGELSLYLAGLRLPPHRLALLVLMPIALHRLLSDPGIRARNYDFLVLAFGAWTAWAYTYHTGWSGFVFGAATALESAGAYFVARVFIRDEEAFIGTTHFLFFAILGAAALALLDTAAGKYFVHSILRKFTSGEPMPPISYRLGMARAASVFDHPIHYGTFCAALLAVFWAIETRVARRFWRALTVCLATLLSMSSAPLLCLILQSTMLLWERITRGINLRTSMTLAAIFGLFIGVSLMSNRTPVQIIATSFTLDPWTGFYRTMIWHFGLESVWQHPWMGLGLGDWNRPVWMVSSTIDTFWLAIAIRTGIPGVLLLILPIVLLGRDVFKRAICGRDIGRRILARGWMISLIAFCLAASTVHLWNVVLSFFFFFVGLGGWFADSKQKKSVTVKKKKALMGLQPISPGYSGQRPAFPGLPEPVYG